MKELDRKSVKVLYFLMASVLLTLAMWTPKKGGVSLLLLLGCNLFSLLSAYLAASKLFDSVVTGMVGGLLYTFVPYRFYSLGSRGDYWEGLSWAVLPLIWYAGAVFARKKKGIPGRVICAVCMAGAGLCAMNLPLWVRDVKALIQGQFTLEGRISLQDGGLYPAHYLMTFFRPGTTVDFANQGMVDSAPVGIGVFLLAGVVCYLWLCWIGKTGGDCYRLFLAAGMVVMLCSTNLFPWDNLRFSNKLYTLAVFLVQDAARLVGIAACCFWIVGCRALNICLEWKKREEP